MQQYKILKINNLRLFFDLAFPQNSAKFRRITWKAQRLKFTLLAYLLIILLHKFATDIWLLR